ncbi:MAG: anaerobic ribonucleoside-triphosphate reductase activating protein [Oscillospiraceae bacterium]|nr:anaerobic ribonucleoside-triphosphate reductase activating protein [Oscillospiraceae bacterium]
MNYAAVKRRDVANGTGVRVSLFVSGCTHHCRGCFNPETWDFEYGSLFDENAENEIISYLEPEYIRGISVLGGEPMEPENQKALLPFIRRIKEIYPEKDVWLYTGYLFDTELTGNGRAVCEATAEILSMTDVLVDGEFEEDKRNLRLRFRGSENQRIIDVRASLSSGRTVLMDL